MKAWAWLAWWGVGGCDLVRGIQDAAEGVTNPNVVIGLVVRAEADDEALPELRDVPDYAEGLSATLFLADARRVDDIGSAPVQGAEVRAIGCGEEVELEESPAGTYRAGPGTPLDACDAPGIELRRVDAGGHSAAPVALPPAADVSVPATWSPGQDMELDLSEQGFGSVLVTVVDLGARRVSYSNQPEGVLETYRFLTGNQDVGEVVIPGSAFGPDTVHAVIVTGLVRTPNADLTSANTALSVVMGGRARPYPVTTLELPDSGLLPVDSDAEDSDTDLL